MNAGGQVAKRGTSVRGASARATANPRGAGVGEVGRKDDAEKFKWSRFTLAELWLWPFEAFNEISRVLVFGARKYQPHNWALVPDAHRRYYDAAMRHLHAYFCKGECRDSESGLHTLAHAAACVLFLLALDLRGEFKKRSTKTGFRTAA